MNEWGLGNHPLRCFAPPPQQGTDPPLLLQPHWVPLSSGGTEDPGGLPGGRRGSYTLKHWGGCRCQGFEGVLECVVLYPACPAPGPLHLLFSPPGILSPRISNMACALPFESLFRCHLHVCSYTIPSCPLTPLCLSSSYFSQPNTVPCLPHGTAVFPAESPVPGIQQVLHKCLLSRNLRDTDTKRGLAGRGQSGRTTW